MARSKAVEAKTKLIPAVDDDEVARWKEELELADRERNPWEKRCEKIIKRYRDQRDGADQNIRRMNILWSNVQTLLPSLYGRQPIPIVERRFLDKDPVGRVSSQILERALRYDLEDSHFHDSVKRSVLDYLLTARGTVWLRYEPYIGKVEEEPEPDEAENPDDTSETTGDTGDGNEESGTSEPDSTEQVLSETVCVDYVNWKDFYTLPPKARTWDEVEAVAKRCFMSREQLTERFGQLGEEVPLDHKPSGEKHDVKDSNLAKASVFEIWCVTDRKVTFIAKDYNKVLEQKDDPLRLEDFWPCPKPLYGTLTNETLIPVPDFVEYQDQALEIDTLTQRISKLTSALKVAGVYDASSKGGLDRLLTEDCENELIPVNSWAAFAEKGGLQGAISFLPIKEVAEVLAQLIEVRSAVKQDCYEITGIADIIRGQSDPNETAKAQAIKGRFATMRLQDRQMEVARYCRDIIRLAGEIIAEHFNPETLIQSSGIMYEEGVGPDIPKAPKPPQQPQMPPQGTPLQPEQAQQVQQAMQAYQQQLQAYQAQAQQIEQLTQQKQQLIDQAIGLLRQDKLRGFRIDIETDTTIADDAQNEKGERVEFITAVSGFLEKAMMAGQQSPEIVPLLVKTLQFGIRGFRVGRDLENAFEEFGDLAEKRAKQQQAANEGGQAQPHPEAMKAQAAQAKAQAEVTKAQIEAQSEQANAQINAQAKQFEVEVQRMQAQIEQLKHQQQMQFETQKHQFKMRELAMAHNGKSDEEMASEQQKQFNDQQAQGQRDQMLSHVVNGVQALHQHAQQMTAHAQQLNANQQNTHAALTGIAQHIAAPAEIIRDQAGQTIGVRKGAKVMSVQRDAAGKVAGIH